MRIVLVEDDHLQAEWIQSELERDFGVDSTRVERVSTEQEFLSRVESLAKKPPDVVVMDVMIRWTDPKPNMSPPPDDVQEGGPFRAGLRCWQHLARRNPRIPIVFYTVLDKTDIERDLPKLDADYLHLQKTADPKALIERVRLITGRRR